MTEDKIIRQISLFYYSWLILVICLFALGAFLDNMHWLPTFSTSSFWGYAIENIVIFDMLLTIPLGLYLHKKRCEKIILESEKSVKVRLYRNSAIGRIIIVGNTIIFSVFAFFLLGRSTSMLYVNFIILVGLFFTKPSKAKMYHELKFEKQEFKE